MKQSVRMIWLVAGIALLATFLTGCGDAAPVTDDFFAMDTVFSQTLYGDRALAETVMTQAKTEIFRLDELFSPAKEGSLYRQIAALPAGGTIDLSGSPEQLAVVKSGFADQSRSGGLFDLSVGAVTALWNVTGTQPRVPSREALQKALAASGDDSFTLDKKGLLTKHKAGALLDFGGLAKGYAADRLLQIYQRYLDKEQIKGGFCSLGGCIAVLGTKPDDSPFTFGLRQPDKNGNEIFGKLSVSQGVISTSGGYERFFEAGGKKYAHIFNPKTGYPVESQFLSVTVWSKSGMDSDFWSTYLYCLPRNEALARCAQEKLQVVLMDTEHTVWISKALQTKFTGCTLPVRVIENTKIATGGGQ